MPGAGKSTLARGLARALGSGWAWADTDKAVETAVGMSVADYFAHAGEAAFRQHELAALERAINELPQAVIATGGGLPAQPGAMPRLNATGLTVWLDVPLETLAQRLRNSKTVRPLLQGDLLENLSARLEARTPFYAQAQVRVPGQSLSAARLAAALAPYLTESDAARPAESGRAD